MNEILFFGGATLIVGLSYYLGQQSGLNKNYKAEIRDFIMGMTVSKMTSDYFDRCAKNETRQFLKFLGVKKPIEKFIIVPKRPTVEEFDKLNKD
jgi:hypothetical protein